MALSCSRRWAPQRPVDVVATLGTLRRGAQDPTFQLLGGALWWATSTPEGDGTLAISTRHDASTGGEVHARAWGEGAEWLCDTLPDLLGETDDPSGFVPLHPPVDQAWRRTRGWRTPRTRRPFDACVASVIEQKVTGLEARSSWRRLVNRWGRPAPGPVPVAMFVPPSPAAWRDLPEWEYRRAGVTPQRIRTIRVAAAAASAIDRTADLPGRDADQLLRSLPGIGVWTSAEVRQRAHGDADAVSFGDFHVAKDICWWLTGRVGDDTQLATVLAGYTGHRYRVQRLMELSGAGAPRRGPRLTIPAHRSW